jgi:hypothetical protein
VKLVIVLILAIIFMGPTLAKTFSKQPEPQKKRGIFYRMGRRLGFGKLALLVVLLFAVVPTALWLVVR